MLVDPSTSAAGFAVTGAIRQAASATGTSFHYLLATAQVESGLNPQAGATTSSARGLFQFVEQTWLATLKQAGSSLGYGQYADAITKDASGQYQVSDPGMRSEILKLRNDPTTNAVMAGAFTKANAALLSDQLGRAPSEGELYIAHFLGAGGAAKLITAASTNPNASAASYFPGAAQANTSIFYDRSTGTPRTLAQVRDVLIARYDLAARVTPDRNGNVQTAMASEAHPIPPMPIPSAPDPATAATAAPVATSTAAAANAATPAVPATVPDTAGMASAFAAAIPKRAAGDTAVFHGLFTDPDRTGPVSAVVSQLWGIPTASGGNGGAALPAGALMNLFKDDGSHNA
jgi:Transglycosylase SLT domain